MTGSTNTHFTHRAFQARQFSLDSTNPLVRAIYRELDQRFRQLAAFPNSAPIGHTDWPSHPTEDAFAWQPDGVANAGREVDRDEQASTRDNDNWENEGGKCARGHAAIGCPVLDRETRAAHRPTLSAADLLG